MHWTNVPLKTKPPWKLMFLGTDYFGLTILEALHADLIKRFVEAFKVTCFQYIIVHWFLCQLCNMVGNLDVMFFFEG